MQLIAIPFIIILQLYSFLLMRPRETSLNGYLLVSSYEHIGIFDLHKNKEILSFSTKPHSITQIILTENKQAVFIYREQPLRAEYLMVMDLNHNTLTSIDQCSGYAYAAETDEIYFIPKNGKKETAMYKVSLKQPNTRILVSKTAEARKLAGNNYYSYYYSAPQKIADSKIIFPNTDYKLGIYNYSTQELQRTAIDIDQLDRTVITRNNEMIFKNKNNPSKLSRIDMNDFKETSISNKVFTEHFITELGVGLHSENLGGFIAFIPSTYIYFPEKRKKIYLEFDQVIRTIQYHRTLSKDLLNLYQSLQKHFSDQKI